MRLVPARAWALVIISAILQLAIFPIAGPLPAWRAGIAWFALVPFLLALLQPGRDGAPLTPRNATLLGYLCGIVWYMGNCYWIEQTMHIYGGMPEALSVFILILFALYLGLYHALFALLIAVARKSFSMRNTLLLAPFAWVAVELARARITGFPWDLLGYSQIDNSATIWLAPLFGVMSIGFLLAAVNAGFAGCFVQRRRWKFAVAGLVALICLQLFASVPSKKATTPTAYSHNAVMMQENLEVGAVGKSSEPLGLSQELNEFSAWSLHPKYSGGAGAEWVQGATPSMPATVVIWPEAPSHLMSSDLYFRAALGQLARAAGAPVIAGSLGIERDPAAEDGYNEYDSASLFDAAGNYTGRYDKIHLVPWGEYTPFPAIFGFVHKLTEGIGNMKRGHARTVFSTGGHSYGVFVCYESIFGDEVRHFAANGAEVLVQISDDGWYGDSGAPWQHLNMARMRAIENHRWLLRSTNTGITTAIDPQGRMLAQAPRHTRAAYAFPFAFEPATDTTFYTRHGDWFAYLCALVTMLSLIRANPFRSIRGKSFARA